MENPSPGPDVPALPLALLSVVWGDSRQQGRQLRDDASAGSAGSAGSAPCPASPGPVILHVLPVFPAGPTLWP